MMSETNFVLLVNLHNMFFKNGILRLFIITLSINN